MRITDQAIDQAYSDLKAVCGGVRNDYFGLLYLENEFGVPREEARNYVAFGGNDYGIDGFHFARDLKNFYLFQFKYTEAYIQFKGSFKRLIEAGVERAFAAQSQDSSKNQLLLQLGSCLLENQAIIERVYFHFVFMGDPEEAEHSQVLDKLREDLENKKYLMDGYFGRPVTLVIEFRSAKTKKTSIQPPQRKTRSYLVDLGKCLACTGPNGEEMLIGLIKLSDLYHMHQEMKSRFFERNIRFALPEEETVNRALARAFRRIVLDETDYPAVFVFNHNGVAFAATKVENQDGKYKITEPRLLNGAQTVTTFSRFVDLNKDNPAFINNKARMDEIRVMCKIITDATQEFITAVTINNNRQNPVEPWNLHANDMIQLELQDKFRDDLGVYYERQEKAFEALSDEELEEIGISDWKPVELLRLAHTFFAADGEIDKMSSMRRVFEEDKIYSQVFNQSRLNADSRKILLCYKVQFRLRRLIDAILEKGTNKYGFIMRGRQLLWALMCQGMLNDPEIERTAETFGRDMAMSADFTEYLRFMAINRCRYLVSDLMDFKENIIKINEGKFSFLRTNASYKRCMEFAYKRWRWVEKKLK
jgi:hypothetical protein